MKALFDFHKVWGYVAIVANAIVGVLARRRVAHPQGSRAMAVDLHDRSPSA